MNSFAHGIGNKVTHPLFHLRETGWLTCSCNGKEGELQWLRRRANLESRVLRHQHWLLFQESQYITNVCSLSTNMFTTFWHDLIGYKFMMCSTFVGFLNVVVVAL